MAIKDLSGTTHVDFQQLRKIAVYDEDCNALPLSRIFEGQLAKPVPNDEKKRQRVLIVFIRHFFCGLCQEYLRRLAEHSSFSEESLASRNTRLVIIGCGAPSLIKSYRSGIDLPATWLMYADPTLRLHDALSMNRSYSLGDHPDYVQQSTVRNMLGSVAQAIRRLSEGDVFSAGDWNVQGGEFLFESDPFNRRDWNILWNHRMTHSRDHTEVDKLAEVLNMPSSTLQSQRSQPHQHLRAASSPIALKNHALGREKYHDDLHRKSSIRRYVSIRRHSREAAAMAGG